MQTARLLIIASIKILTALGLATLPSWPNSRAADSGTAYRDAVRRHPQLVRYYTFDEVSPANPVVPSQAGEPEALSYTGKKPLEVTAGSLPKSKAVRLDQEPFQTKPLAVTDSGFTVEIRFRKHGQGTERGNGNTNGLIFAQGDGYWTGMRVWTGYPDRRLRFEMGRPKPASAFGMTASDPVPDGVWHHLAATWDGREMRLYLNGMLL
nr:LamG domain-containing protein [Pirellulaceae bacterium]